MATSWRDILDKVLAEREGVAIRSVSPVSSPEGVETAPNRPNRPNGTLPADLVAGFGVLASMPCPTKARSDRWDEVVRDALALSETWAVQAFGLGWSALDLFGAVTDPAGDPYCDGLAVKLDGRRVLAICKTFATVADANGGRTCLYRGETSGARLLWALGRGR